MFDPKALAQLPPDIAEKLRLIALGLRLQRAAILTVKDKKTGQDRFLLVAELQGQTPDGRPYVDVVPLALLLTNELCSSDFEIPDGANWVAPTSDVATKMVDDVRHSVIDAALAENAAKFGIN